MDRHTKSFWFKPVSYIGMVFCTLIFSFTTFGQHAQATNYFISPTGSDSNNGVATTSPWKTFKFALNNVKPGDTLILLDGTYDASNSGFPNFTNINGTGTQPITIKAQNERKAHIHNPGNTNSVYGSSCSYLVFEGLQVSSNDNSSVTNNGNGLGFYDCHHLVFKRLLVHHNNRYANSGLLNLIRVTDSLVEDSEFYFHHRHAVLAKPGARNTFRRIYCNSRGYGNIPGGYPNGHGTIGGDTCISLYPSVDSLVENSIAEGHSGALFDVIASGEINADNNRFFGNIAFNTGWGVVLKARPEPGRTALAMPKNNIITDLVVFNAEVVGAHFRGNRGTRCDRCMLFNNANNSGLLVDVESVSLGDGVYSFFSDNSLSLNNGASGFFVTSQIQTWAVKSPNSFGNKLNYNPLTSANWVTNKTVDALLGTCRVWIPDNSPMKKAGLNGSDIGATILYRYENGILTSKPLWDPVTGEFPHGAIVGGLNDVPGHSLFDVHKRLNVNTNGCPFPASYGKNVDTTPPQPPQNVAVR